MKLDNQRNTYRIWISRLVTAIVFTLVIVLIIFIPWFDEADSTFGKYSLIIIIATIYIVINIYNYLKHPFFISYSDHGEMIVLRYYPLSLFTARKHSIEIPKKQFIKYELKSFLLGREQKIILYQNFRDKIAKFPPISLSALDQNSRKQLLDSLDKYVKV